MCPINARPCQPECAWNINRNTGQTPECVLCTLATAANSITDYMRDIASAATTYEQIHA